MKRYKYISFVLVLSAILACCMALGECFVIKSSPLNCLEIEKVSDNFGTILATVAGSFATCAMFMWQNYEFEKRLLKDKLHNKKENIFNIVHELITERNSIRIRCPQISNLWQEIKQKNVGIEAFQYIYILANTLHKNLNEKVYLSFDEDISEQLHKTCSDKISKWSNSTNKDELKKAYEDFEHTKKQMFQGLCNKFVGLNENVYYINHNKPENEKKRLCAYYILETYQRPLAKYLELLHKLSQKIQDLNENYDVNEIEDVKDYIQSVFCLSEKNLIKDFLAIKSPDLTNLLEK